ncbi:hypothetical protein HN51_043180, partial [Arachis hypogaea]
LFPRSSITDRKDIGRLIRCLTQGDQGILLLLPVPIQGVQQVEQVLIQVSFKVKIEKPSVSSDAENSGNNLYVTGLSPRITKRELEKHFAAEGKVIDVHLVVDPWTRESRGFGFVTMANLEDADRCVKYLNCSVLEGSEAILRTVGKDALLKLVTYASDQTYSSLLKVCQIGGLNPELCRSLKTDASTNYALSPEVFSEAVSRDIASGLIPFFLCATVGTTSSTVPGATTLAEKLNHQGIDVVSLSQIKEGFSFKDT